MAQNRLDKRRARNRNIKLYVLMNEIDEGRFYRQNKLKNIPVQFFFQIYDVFGASFAFEVSFVFA